MLGTRDPRGITIHMSEMPLLTSQNPCLAAPTEDQASVNMLSQRAADVPVLGVVDDRIVGALLNRPHAMPLAQLRRDLR
jgi:hypothetical protein